MNSSTFFPAATANAASRLSGGPKMFFSFSQAPLGLSRSVADRSSQACENSPRMYRNLVDATYTALKRTGHAHDRLMFGELAPRGAENWGVFSGMKPLIFLRAMYCVDSQYRPLRGAAAAIRGCPTNAAGSRQFRAKNPALFTAAGVADHPYMRWYPPNREKFPDPNNTSLGQIGNLTRSLDRLNRMYGSHKRFPIYNTEFGYITTPPVSIWRRFGLKPRMLRSSSLAIPADLRGQDRILEILRLLGGNRYINAPGGRALYDAAQFERRGIELKFLPPFAGRTNSILYEFCFHPIDALRAELPDMV